ncbi:MAG: fumarylacetoacetase [Frankiaceae bacterium]|jgi:fumarylacetoacetase|nr:fumarylacetoacetase [Frankiaceae bacterium]
MLPGRDGPRVVVRAGDFAVDLATLAGLPVLAGTEVARNPQWWQAGSLDPFLAAGRAAWQQAAGELGPVLADMDAIGAAATPLADVQSLLSFTVGDYVDFYASEHHATNLGRILRPGQEPLPPNWRHLPIGYHGRSGTIVVSGTAIRRPSGQRLDEGADRPVFGPTRRLDVETEVGFVVGVPSRQGEPVPVGDFAEHVFGVCLVNDWSARDIQAWEGQPLGPFLGKSFATSVSPWIVPLDELAAARRPVTSAGTDLLPYLRETEPWGLDLSLELRVNDEVLSRPPYATMFWSPAQMLAHMTVNGASVRTGDLYASGTVSGPSPDQVGSLIELGRGFLDDGDEVVIRATAPAADGSTMDLGAVSGTVAPAASPAAGRRG